jgi:beta-glucosidase
MVFTVMQNLKSSGVVPELRLWCSGYTASENYRLLQQVLREEWGFDGPVISDWYIFFFSVRCESDLVPFCRTGTYSTSLSIHAGLDLEM